jgi:hypothetical protein
VQSSYDTQASYVVKVDSVLPMPVEQNCEWYSCSMLNKCLPPENRHNWRAASIDSSLIMIHRQVTIDIAVTRRFGANFSIPFCSGRPSNDPMNWCMFGLFPVHGRQVVVTIVAGDSSKRVLLAAPSNSVSVRYIIHPDREYFWRYIDFTQRHPTLGS